MNTMKHTVVVVCLWLVLLVSGEPAAARSAAGMPGLDTAAIDRYILQELEREHIPGLALGIVQNGQVVYLQAYGEADPSGRAVIPQTPFITGSVGKAITALAVMQLVEAGKIELDAPVQHYLPDFYTANEADSAKITVRHLLNQTSGLPMWSGIITFQSYESGEDALLQHVSARRNVPLDRPVGSSFEYSNSNYILLGLIVQEVSGQLYEDYVQAHIFDLLEMENSYLSQEEALQRGLASGYRWWFGYPLPASLPYPRGDLPAGFHISTAQDMTHLMIAFMNGGSYMDNTVLSADGIRLMQTPPADAASAGWAMGFYLQALDGVNMISMEGGTANYQSAWAFIPAEETGVVILSNVMNLATGMFAAGSAYRISREVLGMVSGYALASGFQTAARLYRTINLVVAVLTSWLVVSLVLMPLRLRWLRRRKLRKAGFVFSLLVILLVHFGLPLAVFWGLPGFLGMPAAWMLTGWGVMLQFMPDLTWWLLAVGVVLMLKGLFECWRIRMIYAGQQATSG